ncbi:hypothetical protein CYMTET_21946 [Cymbomonas tetramitiformis]|uniref:Uncharacterized protein n=1 Tax=Cymbomonas tetramitiformis TaxID=36881 RepID=A0AAE0G1C6_9CHLO|nr:hypothetical protein CYMTET_21946 [Cymbomonas tetramitiformis]
MIQNIGALSPATPYKLYSHSGRRPSSLTSVLDAAKCRTVRNGLISRRTRFNGRKKFRCDASLNKEELNIFEKAVPENLREKVAVRSFTPKSDNEARSENLFEAALAVPELPGVPRPVWQVVAFSVPTGLLWYGWYKFAVEEELAAYEKSLGQKPVGYGGYATMGAFVGGLALGPLAEALSVPGGAAWSAVGGLWIYYTQYLLYKRVNLLYSDKGAEEPLTVWWLVFPGFNLLIGLRQLHFLAKFWAEERGEELQDPVADFFPFISCPDFGWKEFLRTPSLWLAPLKDVAPLEIDFLKD